MKSYVIPVFFTTALAQDLEALMHSQKNLVEEKDVYLACEVKDTHFFNISTLYDESIPHVVKSCISSGGLLYKSPLSVKEILEIIKSS
jgi:hypothetical protein